MKEYIKPTIVDENIELDDIIAVSGVSKLSSPTDSHNISTTPTNDHTDL